MSFDNVPPVKVGALGWTDYWGLAPKPPAKCRVTAVRKALPDERVQDGWFVTLKAGTREANEISIGWFFATKEAIVRQATK